MSGVMRLILDKEEGSARGDEDFFSVARTMPLVADFSCQHMSCPRPAPSLCLLALDAECSHTLVDGVQGILCPRESVIIMRGAKSEGPRCLEFE